jgi:Mn-dependent DtxR family transcriptional regulator
MPSTSIEDYIKAIYRLESENEPATTQRIARQLGVRMASVTGMVKHLAAEGYLRHKPYYGVKLTEKGRRVALNVIRRHRLIELFLHQTLAWIATTSTTTPRSSSTRSAIASSSAFTIFSVGRRWIRTAPPSPI